MVLSQHPASFLHWTVHLMSSKRILHESRQVTYQASDLTFPPLWPICLALMTVLRMEQCFRIQHRLRFRFLPWQPVCYAQDTTQRLNNEAPTAHRSTPQSHRQDSLGLKIRLHVLHHWGEHTDSQPERHQLVLQACAYASLIFRRRANAIHLRQQTWH